VASVDSEPILLGSDTVSTVFFVTGGSGFIGGRLIERLRADGHAVRGTRALGGGAERGPFLGAAAGRARRRRTSMTSRRWRVRRRRPASWPSTPRRRSATGGSAERSSRRRQRRGNPQRPWRRAPTRASADSYTFGDRGGVARPGQPLVQVRRDPRPPATRLAGALQARPRREGPSSSWLAANRDGFETVVVRPRFVWGRGDTSLLADDRAEWRAIRESSRGSAAATT